MQGASAVAQKADRLESIFYNTHLSRNGIYALKLHVLGVPTTVTVDDSLPLVGGNSLFGAASPDGALWGMLVEKAFAKIHGNYEAIEGGDSKASVGVLTGAPAVAYSHGTHGEDALWNFITAAVAAGDMITAGTPGTSDRRRSARGIAQNHGYTVLAAEEVDGNRLVRVRNPWGREDYSGPWNDQDTANWDPAIQAQVTYVNDTDDGMFYIPISVYREEFSTTNVHRDVTNMTQTYFLGTNDDSADAPNPDRGQYVAGGSRHTFRVTSPVAQLVYLAAHVWPDRSYPDDCGVKFETGEAIHRFLIEDADDMNPADGNDKDTWWGFRD